MIPIPPTRTRRCLVAGEAMLEVVEYRKLLAGHNVCVGCRLHPGPYLAEGVVEDLANDRVRGAIWAFAGNLEGLDHRWVAGVGDGRVGRGAGRGRGDRGGPRQGWFGVHAMRHGASALGFVLMAVVLVLMLVLMLGLGVVVLAMAAVWETSLVEGRLLLVADVVVWMVRMQDEHCRRREEVKGRRWRWWVGGRCPGHVYTYAAMYGRARRRD